MKHNFRLNKAWWIFLWVIVLFFTLGGLLGYNPLLSETRPNTTSLISLLRLRCHEVPRPIISRRPVPMTTESPSHFHQDFTVSRYLRSGSLWALAAHLAPASQIFWKHKSDDDGVSYHRAAGPQHAGAERQCLRVQAFIVKLFKEVQYKSLTCGKICLDICSTAMKSLGTTLKQCITYSFSVFISSLSVTFKLP